MSRTPAATFLVLSLLATVSLSQAQVASLTELRAAFQRLDYAAADTLAARLLEEEQKLSPVEILEIHEILAIIAFTEGRPVDARRHFELALSIDPQLRLDPVRVSPKIVDFLEQVRADFQKGGSSNQGVRYRYLLVPDPRPGAALRSLIFPGLGQFYKGNRMRGFAFLIAGGSGLIATVTLTVARSQARDDYLAERDIDRIPDRYDRYNRLNKQRNLAALFTAIVWAGSFLDALLTPTEPERPGVSLQFTPSSQTAVPLVRATMRF